jgi:type I restriction enzyme S subunit
VGLEHIDPEDIHIRRFGSPDDVSGGKLKCYPGDVIFGKRRAYQRKAAIVEFEGICSAHAFVFRANPEVIDPKLFPFFLHSDQFMHRMVDISVGGLSPTINWGDLKHQEFLLPPKSEQARFAELLWAMDEVIEREKEVIQKVVLHQKITSKDYIGSEFSQCKNFKNLRIKDFSKVQTGATPLRARNDFFENGQTFWVKTLDLNNGRIFNTEEKITQIALDQTSCKVRPIDTVLVAMYGGFNQIGRTGILKIPAATNQAISAVTVDNSIILPEFLLFILNNEVDYWKKVAISSRKDPNITKNDVENFPVLIPPLTIQESVLKKMETIDTVILNLKTRIEHSRVLQKSLINQFF